MGKPIPVSAGRAVLTFDFHNSSKQKCKVEGFPKILYLSRHGNVKNTTFQNEQGAAKKVEIAPKHKAESELEVNRLTKDGKECPKAKRTKPYYISVTVPGSNQDLRTKPSHPNKIWTCQGYGSVGPFTAPSQ